MEIVKFLIIFISTILINTAVSRAVECYQCSHLNGTGSPDCVEPFPFPVPLTNITVIECEKYCIKSVTLETTSNAMGAQVKEFYATTRTCGAQCIEACYKVGPGRARETCTYCCEGELCNSADTVLHSLTVLMTLLVTALGVLK